MTSISMQTIQEDPPEENPVVNAALDAALSFLEQFLKTPRAGRYVSRLVFMWYFIVFWSAFRQFSLIGV